MVKGCDYHITPHLIRNPEVKGWANNKTNQPPYPSPLMGEESKVRVSKATQTIYSLSLYGRGLR